MFAEKKFAAIIATPIMIMAMAALFRIRYRQARNTHDPTAVHRDSAYVGHRETKPLQPSGSPPAYDTADTAEEERYPTEGTNLRYRKVPDADQIARDPIPIELQYRTIEEAASHHGPG